MCSGFRHRRPSADSHPESWIIPQHSSFSRPSLLSMSFLRNTSPACPEHFWLVMSDSWCCRTAVSVQRASTTVPTCWTHRITGHHLPVNPGFERGDFYSLLILFARGHNYYHWVHDVVLRLHDIVDRLPLTARFVVPSHRRPFEDEYLSIAGVNAERLWEFDGGIVQLENLYFSPPSALSGTDSPAAEIWLRDRALSTYGIALGPARRRVYITRRNARYRRIVNECEVEALLQEFGFETHELESYSVRDQIALFAEAEIVAAAHGAGLTNILFSPPGLRVIDIFEGSLFNKCFWGISTALGHHYWPLVGDTVTNGHSAHDIRVSIPEVERIVSESA